MKKYNFYSVSIIRSYNLTAKMIHLGMFLWCIFRFKKPKKSYNHCEIRFGNLTSGAIASGVKTRKWDNYYNESKKQVIDYELKLTNEEMFRSYLFLKSTENIPYEFENFLWHLIKIITGFWIGSKTNNHTYCYEHGIRWINNTFNVELDVFMNPWQFKEWADKNYDYKIKRFNF